MSKLSEKSAAVGTFFSNVAAETKKTTWPNRHELMQSTVVVIVSVLLLAAFVGLCDQILLGALQLLVQAGGR